MWILFKVFNLLKYCFFGFFMLWFGLKACGILALWSGIKRTHPAVEGEALTTGPPGKSSNKGFWVVFFFLKETYSFFFFNLLNIPSLLNSNPHNQHCELTDWDKAPCTFPALRAQRLVSTGCSTSTCLRNTWAGFSLCSCACLHSVVSDSLWPHGL